MNSPPVPRNEPVLDYRQGSPERGAVRQALDDLTAAAPHRLPLHIGSDDVEGTGTPFTVTAPHRHQLVLGEGHTATEAEVTAAIDAALRARRDWAEASFESRAAVFLRAADLLAGPWRARVNAATMLGQSKTVFQAEIDAAAELIDFWRFNVHFAAHLNDEQPISPPGVWNRMELRALEGFVLAITPFNFTSIAGNLPTAPALMGNTVVWKPATTQQLAASALMQVLREAGLPPGVINMVTGHSGGVAAAALPHPDLAGIHFTGFGQARAAPQRALHGVAGGHAGRPDLHPNVGPAVRHVYQRQGFRARDGQPGVRRCHGEPADAGLRRDHGRPDRQIRRRRAGGGVPTHHGQTEPEDQALRRGRESRRRQRADPGIAGPVPRALRPRLLQFPRGRCGGTGAKFESGKGRGEGSRGGGQDGGLVPQRIGTGQTDGRQAHHRVPAHFVFSERPE